MKDKRGNKSALTLNTLVIVVILGFFPVNCKKIEPERKIMVKTGSIGEVTHTTCRVTATLLDVGVSGVEEHGFCWSLTSDPADAIGCTNLGPADKGKEFEQVLEGLQPGTSYYIWAYATGDETVQGKPLSFGTPAPAPPSVETGTPFNVTFNSAQTGGNVNSDGGAPVSARGVCWNTSPEPTLDHANTPGGAGTGEFVCELTGLEPETKYYVRAYATNSEGTVYGNEQSFTTGTQPVLPELTTNPIEILNWNSATGGGNITSDGGAPVTARGVCWNTSPEPTLDHASKASGDGTGEFVCELTGLEPETKYYVRAYATNSVGTEYGDEQSFTTPVQLLLAELTTNQVEVISWNSAVSGGNIISDGGSAIIERGLCWGLSPNPDKSGPFDISGEGLDSFTIQMNDLLPETEYHVRAYAINGVDIAFGNEQTFTTPIQPLIAELTTNTVEEITWNSAVCGGNIISDGGSAITERGLCWGLNPNPDKSDFFTTSGDGANLFSIQITGLMPETEYHVRAYAINGVDIAFGEDLPFTTPPQPVNPVVVTFGVTGVQTTSATSGGSITSDGWAPILSKGLCWSATVNEPTLSDSYLEFGSGSEPFNMEIAGLKHNTKYFVRAYATNEAGMTGYGEPISFTTLFQCGAQLQDPRDGRTYFTVSIGEQCWMAENLNVGVFILSSEPQTDNGGVPEKYCYDNDQGNCDQYGGQYTWDEMMQYTMLESSQGVCPSGWHIPSDIEWKIMERSLGMTIAESDATLWRGVSEGGMLKSGGLSFWNPPNTGATNSTLFSALPSGMVWNDGSFSGLGDFAVFWTSTSILETQAWYRYLHTDEARIYRVDGYRPNSTSVRCVKD